MAKQIWVISVHFRIIIDWINWFQKIKIINHFILKTTQNKANYNFNQAKKVYFIILKQNFIRWKKTPFKVREQPLLVEETDFIFNLNNIIKFQLPIISELYMTLFSVQIVCFYEELVDESFTKHLLVSKSTK